MRASRAGGAPLLQSNLASRTPTQYGDLIIYGQFALSLGKERPYIFSEFKIQTLSMVSSVSVITAGV